MDNILEVFEDSEIVYNKKEEVKMSEVKTVFQTLNAVNVSGFTEQKKDLTYLSWTYAWANVVERYPDANYEIVKYDDGKPYYIDDTGAMVFTKVTIDGVTREMWLPVMDSSNKSMKKDEYKYKTKYGEKTVDPISMFDINKTLMRCLVKNLAMFGIGISVYAGEDLPLDLADTPNEKPKEPAKKTITPPKKTPTAIKLASDKQIGMVKAKIKEAGGTDAGFLTKNKLAKFEDMTSIQASKSIDELNKFIASKAK